MLGLVGISSFTLTSSWSVQTISAVFGALVCSTLNGGKISKITPALIGTALGGTIAGIAMVILAG